MEDSTTTADKRIVEELNFGSKTAKRVGWEAWEFAVEAPHLIRVTNASYGFEKDDHSYLVGVEDRDGLLVPSECECPADKYNEEYACKHRVACATTAGPVVLQAAVDYATPSSDTNEAESETLADRLRADGGTVPEESESSAVVIESKPADCDCSDRIDFPCWPCVRDGQKELPE